MGELLTQGGLVNRRGKRCNGVTGCDDLTTGQLLLLRLLVRTCEQTVNIPQAGTLLPLQSSASGLLQPPHGFVDAPQGQQRLPLQSQGPGDRLLSHNSG